jgi:hypothetical protein
MSGTKAVVKKCELDGKLGLDAFKLFGTYKMAYFLFSMFWVVHSID